MKEYTTEQELNSAEQILYALVDLKVHKEHKGKDDYYQIMQPIIWAAAFKYMDKKVFADEHPTTEQGRQEFFCFQASQSTESYKCLSQCSHCSTAEQGGQGEEEVVNPFSMLVGIIEKKNEEIEQLKKERDEWMNRYQNIVSQLSVDGYGDIGRKSGD